MTSLPKNPENPESTFIPSSLTPSIDLTRPLSSKLTLISGFTLTIMVPPAGSMLAPSFASIFPSPLLVPTLPHAVSINANTKTIDNIIRLFLFFIFYFSFYFICLLQYTYTNFYFGGWV